MYHQPSKQIPPPPHTSSGSQSLSSGILTAQFMQNENGTNAKSAVQFPNPAQFPPPPPPTHSGMPNLRMPPPPLSIPQSSTPFSGSGAGGGGSTPLSIQISSSSSSPVTPHHLNAMSPVYSTYRGINQVHHFQHGHHQVPAGPSYPPIQPSNSQPPLSGHNGVAQNAIKQTPNYFPNILPPPPTSIAQDQLGGDLAASESVGLGIASRSLSQEQYGRTSSFDSGANIGGTRPAGPSSSSSSRRNTNSSTAASVRIEPAQMPRPVFTNMYAHLYQQPSSDDPDHSAGSQDQDHEKESTITISNFHTRSATSRRNPPSCNSPFVSIDTGNCTPRHMRATLVAPPSSKVCSAPLN